MAKFRSKPVIVDAVQWKSGDVIDGVTPRAARIRWSDDRRVFYIEKDDFCPRFWLGAEKRPGEPTEREKAAGFLEPSTAMLKLRGGETYCRSVLDFNFWKVHDRLHIDEPITEDTVQLFLDYAAVAGWDEADAMGVARTAYVIQDNRRLFLKSSDWIITDDKGRKSIMEDEAFRRDFEACDGGFLGVEDEVIA